MIPPATLLIEGPAAIVDASVERHGNRELAEAFLAFLRSAERSASWPTTASARSIRTPPRPHRRPASVPPGLFTMADLGGWDKVQERALRTGGVWTSLFTSQAKGR